MRLQRVGMFSMFEANFLTIKLVFPWSFLVEQRINAITFIL